MSELPNVPCLAEWFEARGFESVTPIAKDSPETSAWFARSRERELFLKLYPQEFVESRAAVETAISGGSLHPAIVPLRETAACREGTLLIYDRVSGESLGPMQARARFQALPLAERIAAISNVCGALAAICDAGFMIVDWYEGNMITTLSGSKSGFSTGNSAARGKALRWRWTRTTAPRA